MSFADDYKALKKKRKEQEEDIAPVVESNAQTVSDVIARRPFSTTGALLSYQGTDFRKAWLAGADERLAQQRFTSDFLANGGQTNSNGERYWKDAYGNTYWEDGASVTKDGISFFTDAKGRNVTEDGYLLDENYRMTNEKVDSVPNIPGSNDLIDSPKTQAHQDNVVSSNYDKRNNDNAWFKNPMDDGGVTWGDAAKGLLGTIADVGVNVIEGFSRSVEGVVDLGFYGAAMGQKWQGNDEMSELLKEMGRVDSTSGLFGGLEEKVDEWSLLGDKADSVSNALGQIILMAGTAGASSAAGVGQLGTSAITTGTSFASSTGQGVGEAYGQGADDATAWKYGSMKGAVDAGSELVFGGLGKGINALGYGKGLTSIDDAFAKKLSSKISNQVLANAAEYGVKAGAEGFEEVMAGFGTAAAKKLSGLSEEDYWDLVRDEDLLDQFVVGVITSGIAQGGDLKDSVKNKTDFVTGLTQNEQKVIDQVYENTITEQEKNGEKLTEREKKAIYDQIVEGVDKGYISIEDIENALGDKSDYDSILKESEEYDNLYNTESGKLSEKQKDRLAELKEKNSTTPYADALEKSKSAYSENVYNILRNERNGMGSKLLESYNERARRGMAYEADLSQYDAKQQAVIQKAIDSGILNNTNRTHEFVDLIAKISADKGVLFDFTNNEKLKGSSFAIEGKTVNGYVTEDGVTLNINSAKALNAVVGHEITHVLEGTEFYTELQNAITEYAKTKGEYQSRYDTLAKLYSGVKDANIEAELTADLVGDYLFTDSNFVRHLSTQNRNVFQKIWDEIKYLYSAATAGSKEARELAKVKKVFEEAYRAGGKAQKNTADGGAKYSLNAYSEQQKKNWENSKRIVIYENSEQLSQFIQEATSNKSMDKKMYFGSIPSDLATKIKTDTGLDVENYNLSLGTNEIRKILKDHGDEKTEAARGQRAVVPEDFAHIVDIVLNPQKVSLSKNTYMGKPAIEFTGEHNGRMNVVAVVSDKRLDLFVQTAYVNAKKRNLSTPTGEQAPINTPEASSGTVSVTNVAQNGENVKYSLSDSDGRKLTNEQQAYFKDSKMRDEQGNLKVMYHGSQDAGFHVFDSSMSDDGTSFFFVDRNDVAASYSGTSETYEAKTIRTPKDMNNFLAEIGYDHYKAVEKNGKFELLENNEHIATKDTMQEIYKEFCWYEGIGEGDANYKVYLNLTNPLEVDAGGRNWNNISREFSQDVYDRYQSLTAEEKAALTDLAEWGEYGIFKDEILSMAKAKADGQYHDATLASAYEKLGGANANLHDAFTIAEDNFSEDTLRQFAAKQMNTRDYAKKAKAEGYDGVIFKNIVDIGGYGGDYTPSTVAIAFDSNQIKSVANEKPTGNADIRYSLSDSEGNKLSNEQTEYFRDSKIRDAEGKLKVMHHGSSEAFTVFDRKKAKASGYYGNGFYFTDSESHAKQYGNTYDVYLNITNPLQDGTNDITKDQLRKFVEAIAENEDYGIENYGYGATVDSVTNSVYGKSDFAMIMDINASCVGNMVEAIELFNEVNGTNYNGIVAATETVAFYPNQIKAVTNQNPTDNPDIHRSLSENGEQSRKFGSYNVYGNDIALEGLAPTVSETESVAPVVENAVPTEENIVAEDIAPVTRNTTVLYQNRKDGWGEVYATAQEALNDAVQNVDPELWNAIDNEIENAVDKKNHPTPMTNALIAVQEDVRQETITPMQGAQLLSEAYRNGGVGALRGLYNPKTGNLWDRYLEKAKQYETVAPATEMFPDAPFADPASVELDRLNRQKAELESRMMEAIGAEDFDAYQQINAEYDTLMKRMAEVEQEVATADADRINSLAVADAPPEMEAPYRGESYDADPFAERDIVDVGKRSVKAYMYENPEVKPFFQAEARAMLGDLQSSIKGERLYNDELYYQSGGEKGWMGTKRRTTAHIAELLDQWNYTYAEIEKGLNAIIEDHGAENNAISKRIEFMLDDRLRNGYDDMWGEPIPADQAYIDMLNERQVNEYSKEAFDAFMANADKYDPAPMEDDIAPVVKTPANVPDAPIFENASGQQTMWEEPAKKVTTRKELHQNLIDDVKARFSEKGLDFDNVLKEAKNLSTFRTVDNTPQRVMEKALGYKAGSALADMTVNKVAQNETEGIKWLNSYTDRKNGVLAQISKQYNIKPGSKESAAAQMYAEGFYVGENNEIIAYGDAELAKDFPNADVQRNIKGLASDPRIRKIYDDTLAMINESRARNLYPEIPRLDNYFLHFRAMEDTFSRLGLPFNPNDIKAKDLPTDLNGVTADLKPGQPYFASAMHRTGKRTSFDLLGGLEKYLSSAKNQIYHIDDIQTMRALRNYIADTYGQANGLNDLDSLSEEEAQERIKEVYNSHLSTFAKFLNEEANILAGKTALIDRGLEGIIGRRGITFLDTVNRQVGSNMVGFNVSSSLTNFISVAQAFAKTNKADFVKAFGQTVGNKVGSMFGRSDSFTENSPVVIRRKGADRFYRTPFQKAGDIGYSMMQAVDNISTELIARTKYNELTRKGMDSQQAHFETDKWVSKLMGDRSLGQMPQLYNSKMLGLFTKFQLEVRNQLDSQFYDTIQETKASNEEIENGLKRNAKTAAKVTSTFVQLAVAQHLFGKAFESIAGYNPAFDIISVVMKAFGWDDEEDSEDTVLDNLEQAFMELLGDLPYTSTFTGGRIPISSALPIEQFIMGEDQYGNEKSRWETLAEIAPYYVLPGGYGQLKKTWQGMSMFSDDHPIAGSYTDSGNLRFPVDDTFGSKLQAGIFGQWANSNAQDYIDNERKPLSEKQIQEFIDVGISIQDYWEYREGLSGLKTLAEKADYINGLDLTDEQKNVLINNIADRKEDIDMSDYGNYGSWEEFDYAQKNPEKYSWFNENGISYSDYANADENAKSAYNWAYENPEKYQVSKAVSDDLLTYYQYKGELYDIKADKDENGKTINGSRKEKVIDYINDLDADYGAKIILFKMEYPADDSYNYDIIDYLNDRDDISYGEMETILKELGFTVHSDGRVTWD